VCVYVHMYILYTHVYIYMCMYTHTHTHTHNIHTTHHTHTHTHTHTHSTHGHTHIQHTHTHTHTHTFNTHTPHIQIVDITEDIQMDLGPWDKLNYPPGTSVLIIHTSPGVSQFNDDHSLHFFFLKSHLLHWYVFMSGYPPGISVLAIIHIHASTAK
jgi:hypothetical protein